MRRDHRLSRRLFLSELGKGTLAVTVLGTGLVACSSDSSSTSSGATSGGGAGSTSTTSTAAPATTAGAGDGADGGAEEAGSELRWERVSFGFVSAYVLARGREVAVVDTGTAGNSAQIVEALGALGATWDDVDHVIVTHAHGDHFGGLDDVLTAATGATGYAGIGDIEKLTAPRELVGVSDGDEIFGLDVIGTPGHTPGHISVLDSGTGLLVAGDAVNTTSGTAGEPPAEFTDDPELARTSLRTLAAADVISILPGHGDPITDGADASLEQLVASF